MMDILSFIRLLAILSIAFIAFMTVGPSDLRPKITSAPRNERAIAFAGTAFLVVISFPLYSWIAAIFAILAAWASEHLQSLFPGRHARFHHAVAKAVGAAIGAISGLIFVLLFADVLAT